MPFQLAIHIKIAPARHPLDAERDHGKLRKVHRRELRIAGAQQGLGLAVLLAHGQNSAEPRSMTQPSRVQSSS